MRRVFGVLAAALVGMVAFGAQTAGQPTLGVPPRDATRCPDEHPVKGYASKQGQGAGVYYLPESSQYPRVSPERCFATDREARDAGYRAGREDRSPAREDRPAARDRRR
jgi:hypothetical protein